MSQGRKVRSQLERVQEQGRVGRHTHDADDVEGQAPVADLPRKYNLRDKGWANRNAMKQQLLGENRDGMTPFGQAQLTDRDLNALLERERIDVAQAFDGWFGKNFNKQDLPTRLLGEELNPEYYKEREEAMVERAQLALRIELMKLYGPRSEEDLILIYGLETDMLQLDKDYDKFAPANDEERNTLRVAEFNNSVSRFLRPNDDPPREGLYGRNPFGKAASTPSRRTYKGLSSLVTLINQ